MVVIAAICTIHTRLSESWVEIPMETEFKADMLDVCSDSDWVGCKATRKSTSGGMFVVDGCCLRSWSSHKPRSRRAVVRQSFIFQ